MPPDTYWRKREVFAAADRAHEWCKTTIGVTLGALISMLLRVAISTYKWQMLKLHRYYFTAIQTVNAETTQDSRLQ